MTSVPARTPESDSPSGPFLICPTCGHRELWRTVPNYPRHAVSSLGRVRSLPYLARLRGGGYREAPGKLLRGPRVVLIADSEYKYVTRRVLFEQVFGSAPQGALVRYRDGDSEHLCAANLTWEFPHLRYRAMHQKVRRLFGLASLHLCVECGGPADDWSYSGSGFLEVEDVHSGRLIRYSLDPAEYRPRCRPCHRTFDGAGLTRPRNSSGQWLPSGAA